LTVHKAGNQWSVSERASYPADVVKLRKLLLSLPRCQDRGGENVSTRRDSQASASRIPVEPRGGRRGHVVWPQVEKALGDRGQIGGRR